LLTLTLNPEERLHADLKQEMRKKVLVRTKAKLREAANEHIAMVDKNPERVIRYFQDCRVRYAAWDYIGPDQYVHEIGCHIAAIAKDCSYMQLENFRFP
jgi:hypothetical protein